MFNAGVRGKRAKDGVGFLSTAEQFNQKSFLVPTVTSFSVTDVSYVPLDDTAVDTSGGQTIVINGSGFASGATVQVGATTIGSVTFIDQNRLAFAAPALSSGSYTIYVTNSNGGTGILVSGLVYSGLPTYTTDAGSLGTVYETANINSAVVATGDAPITYTLLSGTLPSGSNLNSNGTITGNAPVDGSSTTYSFTIQATDAQLQDSTRAFTLTINTDVLSWGLANNTVYTLDGNAVMSNVTLSATSSANSSSPVTFAANTLPTGVSLSGSTIFGTPTTEQTVYSALTATATQTGRTATRFVSWSISLGDLYLKNTTVLLNTSSAANTANTFISDSSINNFTLTAVGDTKPTNFDPYVLGYYSNFFDGTGDYLQNSSLAPNITIGSSDFCLEAWGYWTSFNNGTYGAPLFSLGGTNSQLMIRANKTAASSTTINYYSVNNSNFIPAAGYSSGVSAGTIYLNQWTHVAVSRQGSTWRLFVNGSLVSTQTDAASLSTAYTSLVLGADTTPANGYMTGWISNARVVVGDAIYTAAFTPPTVSLTATANTKILSCQSNRHIDNSLNNYALTKNGDVLISQFAPFTPPTSVTVNNLYSTYFDGTGDYIQTADNTALQMGTSTFTIEFWINFTSIASYQTIISKGYNSAASLSIQTDLGTGRPILYSGGVLLLACTGSAATVNTWIHYALVRNGTTLTWYTNGVATGTTTNSTNISNTEGMVIGTWAGLTYYLNGYLSNLRIVKGTAVYTAAFTPPTANLTAIANTSLLTCQNSTLIDNSNNTFAITSGGDARPIAVSPFTQTTTSVTTTNLGSAYFDGTGDYLAGPTSNAGFLFGTGDFTIEYWAYKTTSAFMTVVSLGQGAGNLRHFLDNLQPTLWDGSTSIGGAGSSTFALNTWNHVVVQRSGTSLRFYINGVSSAVITNSSNFNAGTLSIGGELTSNPFVGYIADLRITKGTALYTANFAPPVAPLTPVANTQLLTVQTNQPSNNSIFIDNSSNNLLISRTGNTHQGSTTPYGDNWSNYFDGTGDYLQTPASSSTTLIGTAALSTASVFTIECWIYHTQRQTSDVPSVIGDYYTTAGADNWSFGPDNTGKLTLYWYDTGPKYVRGNETIPLNTWTHISVVLNASNIKMFVNGTLQTLTGTTTMTNGAGSMGYLGIGQWFNGGATYGYFGYISNLRIVKSALYSTTFTPSTTPLTAIANTSLLTCQSRSFVDNSINNFTLTKAGDTKVLNFNPFSTSTITPLSYSNYFDGTGDYLVTPSISSFTGNFTIELWYYPEIPTNSWYPYVFGTNTPWTTGVGMVYSTQTTVNDATPFYFQVAGSTITIGTYATVKNKWNHLAIVRSGSTITAYLNGVSVGTPLTNSSTIATTTYMIGGVDEGGNYDNHAMKGYISNFRILNGTALYTSNFTPSTTPLTAIANTTLLTCQSSTLADNSNNAYSLTITGNVKPLTQNPFGFTTTTSSTPYDRVLSGSSAYFDGTGDSLSTTATGQFVATGDFTISLWFYITSLAAANHLIGNYTSNLTTDWLIEVINTGAIQVFLDGSTQRLGHTGITTNQWHYLTLTRSGTTVTGQINGVNFNSTATYTMSGTLGSATKAVYMGMRGGSTNPLFGYLSDVRLVSGSTVPTGTVISKGNYIPPTTPLTAVRNTTMLLSMDKAAVTDVTAKSNFETVGDAKVHYETPYAGSYYSNYFDGTGDYLSFSLSQTPFALSNSDFTVEAWVYRTSTSTGLILSGQGDYATAAGSSYVLYVSSSATSDVYGTSFPGGGVAITSPNPAVGTWAHVAWVRTGGTYSSYLNGVRVGTASTLSTNSINVGITNPPTAGGFISGINMLQGYISNLRLIKGSGGYNATSSTITIPTAPLTAIANTSLLTCQSRSFIDNSASPLTITRNGDVVVKSQNPFRKNSGSSIYFDGTTDYLLAPTSPNNATGTGNFTVEFWVLPTAFSNYRSMFGNSSSAVNATGWHCGLNASGNVFIYSNSAFRVTTSNAMTLNMWNHVAITRSGSTVTIYINGTSGGTWTLTTETFTDGRFIFGGAPPSGGSEWFAGYLADLRVTKDVARTITVPTSAFKSY